MQLLSFSFHLSLSLWNLGNSFLKVVYHIYLGMFVNNFNFIVPTFVKKYEE